MPQLRRSNLLNAKNMPGERVPSDNVTLWLCHLDDDLLDSSKYQNIVNWTRSSNNTNLQFDYQPGVNENFGNCLRSYFPSAAVSVTPTISSMNSALLPLHTEENGNHFNLSFWIKMPNSTETSNPNFSYTMPIFNSAANTYYNFNGWTDGWRFICMGGQVGANRYLLNGEWHHIYLSVFSNNPTNTSYGTGCYCDCFVDGIYLGRQAGTYNSNSSPWISPTVSWSLTQSFSPYGVSGYSMVDEILVTYGPSMYETTGFVVPEGPYKPSSSNLPNETSGSRTWYYNSPREAGGAVVNTQSCFIADANARATITLWRSESFPNNTAGAVQENDLIINGTTILYNAGGSYNSGFTQTNTLTNVKLSDYGFVNGANTLVQTGGTYSTARYTSLSCTIQLL